MTTSPYRRIRPVEGGSTEPGVAYHDIPGVDGPVHRPGTRARVDHFAPHLGDLHGKRGLDIGCSVGGISTVLSEMGARMVGYDHDPQAIWVAEQFATGTFHEADIGFIEFDGFDFAVWLSQWMWLAHQFGSYFARRRLRDLSKAVPVLVFETAQGPGDGMAGSDDVEGPEGVWWLLADHTDYRQVLDLGSTPGDTWEGGRHVFICRQDPIITGTVTSGHAAAADDVTNGVYTGLGYVPYPGTLNLAVDDTVAGSLIRPWREIDHKGIARKLWPATYGDDPCHVLVGEDPEVVEILAPWRLRGEVFDGDEVTVVVR